MTWTPPPPSGVAGLSPTEIRARVLENGWAPLPIRRHDGPSAAAGKAPGIKGWQEFAGFEAPRPTLADLAAWKVRERDWPGTGIACGACIGIDLDFATDAQLAGRTRGIAIEVFGETVFERQGAYPKVLLVYRAAEPITTMHLKAADGSGDGLDVLSDGTQLVGFGMHQKTLKPYAWIGAENPLTAELDAAPEITQAQTDEFVARVRAVVELNATGGRAGRRGGAGGGAQIVRDANGKVIDGREYHLTRTVYAAARAMRSEGEDITVSTLAERAWRAFVASTVLDDGRWNPEAVRIKAAALLDRVRRGFVSLDPEPEQAEGETVAPTYSDRRVSVAEAETATTAIVTRFFNEHVPAWKRELALWKAEAGEAEERGQPKPPKPAPVSHAARIETAIGKTAQAIKGAAAAAKAGTSIVYAAPMHSLLAELAERFAAEGVEARVYRGYASPDPETPDLAMCLDLPAMEDAKAAVRPIPSTVCEKKGADGQKHFCLFHGRCGMERQRQANAPVWLVPHALLFHGKPEAVPTPDALVIDEGVTMSALPDKPARLSLDAIERAPIDPSGEPHAFSNFANDLQSARGNLLRALRDHRDDGPLQRTLLIRHGVTAASAAASHTLEWGRLRDPGITPGMEAKSRKALAAAVGQHNTEVKLLAGLWNEVRAFLAGAAEASGRLSLRYDEEAEARFLERRSLDTVRDTWLAPALLIDATLPEAALLEPVMGHLVEVKADITARWSSHVKVRQILGAPVTARKLGIIGADDDGAEGEPAAASKRVVTDLLRLIRLRAALVWPRVVVVIAPMRLVEKLTAEGLPENVETAHFGAVAGIDKWARAAGLICIGRLQPGPGVTEPLAGIVTGTVPGAVEATPQGGRWYTRGAGAIRLADGRGAAVERARHPDEMVEALRWQITEAGLIQAIGRLRALRRGADAPAFLDIINDVPLPISVDATPAWSDAKPGAWAEMTGEGVLLESAADIMACFPEAAPTRKTAREMSLPTLALTSLRELNIDVRANVRRASYKRLGRFAPAAALLLPTAPADLKSWLSDRLGAIEWVKVEEVAPAAKDSEPSPAPADAAQPRRAPLPPAADYDPGLAARYRCASEAPADIARAAPVRAEVVRFDPAMPPAVPAFDLFRFHPSAPKPGTSEATRSTATRDGRPHRTATIREAFA